MVESFKMKTWIELIIKRLDTPTDAASLVLLRIVFGLLMFWEMTRYYYNGWIRELYVKPQFYFQYEWFQWLKPLPEEAMYLLFASLAILSLMITLGLFYRISTILFFLGFSYFFLLERAIYNNHYYLICMLSLMLTLAPLHKSWSLDVLRGSVAHKDKLPALWLWIFRLHMGIVYFYGGIAKFDHDWLNGLASQKLMGEGNRGTFLEPLMQYEWVPYIYAWSGMLFDLLIPFLMLWKRTRNLAFLSVIIFHTTNNFVFSIGVFPMLALMLTLIYYDAGFPRRIVPNKIKIWVSGVYRKRLLERNQAISASHSQTRPLFFAFLGIYFLIQLLIPFRHLTYPGWTTWHEEGHDFAWRMMLRQKTSRMTFNVTHPVTGEQRYAEPEDYLNFLQLKLMGNPRLLLQFAHHLDSLVQKNAGFDPIITARFEVSMNGREFRYLVDPNVDLSEIPKFEPSFLWVKPFGER
jgi:vitamin K-dependent gamma-carboxylase